jgi:hypothetical protein
VPLPIADLILLSTWEDAIFAEDVLPRDCSVPPIEFMDELFMSCDPFLCLVFDNNYFLYAQVRILPKDVKYAGVGVALFLRNASFSSVATQALRSSLRVAPANA